MSSSSGASFHGGNSPCCVRDPRSSHPFVPSSVGHGSNGDGPSFAADSSATQSWFTDNAVTNSTGADVDPKSFGNDNRAKKDRTKAKRATFMARRMGKKRPAGARKRSDRTYHPRGSGRGRKSKPHATYCDVATEDAEVERDVSLAIRDDAEAWRREQTAIENYRKHVELIKSAEASCEATVVFLDDACFLQESAGSLWRTMKAIGYCHLDTVVAQACADADDYVAEADNSRKWAFSFAEHVRTHPPITTSQFDMVYDCGADEIGTFAYETHSALRRVKVAANRAIESFSVAKAAIVNALEEVKKVATAVDPDEYADEYANEYEVADEYDDSIHGDFTVTSSKRFKLDLPEVRRCKSPWWDWAPHWRWQESANHKNKRIHRKDYGMVRWTKTSGDV